ncbi:MAG: hypothetical protein ICV71_04030 [Thermoleophilia bacterium]|jgi:hypothetical protein|nr:hypothetical protein [Thermoleophilia bacterium]MDQ3858797.1 hypothetical protein [Actinomycetota bacterium]
MRAVEHAVDVWDLRGMDPRLDSRLLLEHLQRFAAEGWELVWMGVDVELADHRGPCHVLVFKRVVEDA